MKLQLRENNIFLTAIYQRYIIIYHRNMHSLSLQQTCNYGNRKDIHNMRNKGCCIWKTSRELMTFESAYKCTLHTNLVHDDEKLISGIFIHIATSLELIPQTWWRFENWKMGGERAKKLRWQLHRVSRAKREDLWKWQNDCNYSLTRIQKCTIPWTDSYLSFAMTVCFSIGTLKWALEELFFKKADGNVQECRFGERLRIGVSIIVHIVFTRIASNKIWRTMTTCKLIKFLFVLNEVSSPTYSCWRSSAPTIIIHSLLNVYCSPVETEELESSEYC